MRRNAKGRFVKRGGTSRGRPSRGRALRGNRRGVARGHSLKGEDVVAMGLLAAGMSVDVGGDTPWKAVSEKRFGDAVNQVEQRIPGTPYSDGALANDSGATALVDGAIAVKAIGWAARKLGHRSSHHLRIGKHRIGF